MASFSALRRVAVGGMLIVALAACSSASTPTAPSTATTPGPTVAITTAPAAAFGQAFLAIVDPMFTEYCRGYTLYRTDYEAHPPAGTLAGQKEAYAVIGQALANAAASLRALQPPAVVKNEFGALLAQLDKYAVAGGAVSSATSMTELSAATAAAYNELNGVSMLSGLARAKLGLPSSAPCS